MKTYYMATDFSWVTNQIISNSDFCESPHKSFFINHTQLSNELVNNHDYMARRKVENDLEIIRLEKFPNLPSRKDTLFLNQNITDAKKWINRGSRAGYKIFELQEMIPNKTHEANYIWFNYCVRLIKNPTSEYRKLLSHDIDNEYHLSLENYWNNIAIEQYSGVSEKEILYNGNLRVIKEIFDY